MGNCLFGGMGDGHQSVIRVATSNGGVMEFHAPITVESITDEFPGHGIFRSHDLFWNPLPHSQELLVGQSYCLLPLTDHTNGGLTPGRLGCVRSNSTPQQVAAPQYRMSFDSRGLEKRPPEDIQAGIGRRGFWKVKVVIRPEQLLEILSEEGKTDELIESVRTVAKCGSVFAGGFSDQWSLSSSKNTTTSNKDSLLNDVSPAHSVRVLAAPLHIPPSARVSIDDASPPSSDLTPRVCPSVAPPSCNVSPSSLPLIRDVSPPPSLKQPPSPLLPLQSAQGLCGMVDVVNFPRQLCHHPYVPPRLSLRFTSPSFNRRTRTPHSHSAPRGVCVVTHIAVLHRQPASAQINASIPLSIPRRPLADKQFPLRSVHAASRAACLCASHNHSLVAGSDAGDRASDHLHILTTPLSTTTHRSTTNLNRTESYLTTSKSVHHQPSSGDVLVMTASSTDILPQAKNQLPPADSPTAAPQPSPTPAVPPAKRTYSNVVQNNTVASLHFDPNRAAKKNIPGRGICCHG
ncbi:hypothetical protein Salat_1902900 [Sesamum alatum]|uniref:Uncharacterized protein n=1 Tax=Sesamum alatum TaxID=300844 RepID=A0AAE2CIA2_9LAMI|nr:hypothetical protein Salat_1902900 [Sesamum alatum]